MKVLFLGTGTSHGVPEIDCMLTNYADCPQHVCRSVQHDARHARTRCSILIEVNHKHLLIDVSPDFRSQMLTQQVKKIDAVLLTHLHADHIQGMPDIRSYTKTGPLDIYGSAETIGAVRTGFNYMFTLPPNTGGGVPDLRPHIKESGEQFALFDIPITPGRVEHGGLQGCFGYRIGNLGYVPDVKVMPPETMAIFEGVEILILNMLRRRPDHATHLTLNASVALAKALNPKFCYFVHMNHDIHYLNDWQLLPNNMNFAYDGLVIEVLA